MSEKSALYREVFKSFYLAYKRLSFYSLQHPLSYDILNNLFSLMESILEERTGIGFMKGEKEGQVRLNEEQISYETRGLEEIFQCFLRFKMSGVVFLRGLSFPELADFLKSFATLDQLPQDQWRDAGHIQVLRESVSGENPAPAAALEETEAEKVSLLIFDFLTGKRDRIDAAPEEIFRCLDLHPLSVMQTVLESVRRTGDFDNTFKKFVRGVAGPVAPLVLEHKKNPAGFVDRIIGPFAQNNLEAVFPHAAEVLASSRDEMKLTLAYQAFSVPHLPVSPAEAAVKLFMDEKNPARILDVLPEYMSLSKVPPERAEEFRISLKKVLTADENVAVSKKQLSGFLRVSEHFEEELEDRVHSATQDLLRLNQRLADEKERTDAIIRHVSEGVVVVDKEGRIVVMNPAAEKILTRHKDSLGKYLSESLKDERLLNADKNTQTGETRALTREIQLDSKEEGARKVLRASSAVVENDNGDMIGMVSVLSDITKDKEIEEIKSQFVSLVTHELRTPVVAIQKSLELIDSGVTGPVNEDQRRFLTISKLNLTRLNSLINDLLDMSKLEAGKLVLLPSSFDFRKAVQEVKTSLLSWINDKEINLKLTFPEDPVLVNADRERIVQVLVNLVSNALKFTPKKGQIEILLEPLPRKEQLFEEPCLEVKVRDSGIGIDPKDFQRIFNKFEQASLVSPSGSGGTGLGLAIAKEIVNLHGGQIRVESQKGQGSTFSFVIPKSFHGGRKRA